jgi:hypothetical protein
MAIERINASDAKKQNARGAKFELSTYFVPEGTKFTIASADFVSHKVDGKEADSAVPVLILYRGEDTEANRTYIYLRSFLKIRRTFKDEVVNVQGTLNDLVKGFAGKTNGELVDHLNTLKGRQVEATVTEYRGINKNGDVQSISVNGYNLL